MADSHSAAAAMTLRRQVVARLRGLKLRVLIERDTCTNYEVAITGFPTRSAATKLLHRLRPHFHQARLEQHQRRAHAEQKRVGAKISVAPVNG